MRHAGLFLVLLCGSLPLSGCGPAETLPDLGQVEGVVTLDGEPLPNARVVFLPETGPTAAAITNEEGRYSLINKTGSPGASIGAHKVEISTDLEGTNDPLNEQVPAKYNTQTTLTAQVEAGPNTIDFDLATK